MVFKKGFIFKILNFHGLLIDTWNMLTDFYFFKVKYYIFIFKNILADLEFILSVELYWLNKCEFLPL